jgi:hypothetical protein
MYPIALLLALTGSLTTTAASSYAPKIPPLSTDWTSIASESTNPWTQYPRPQMVREKWQNLNGIWSYRNASSLNDIYDVPSGDLGTGVMIPSCLESALSGEEC